MEPRYQRNPDIVYRPEGLDGAILFEPDSARVQVLNLTGAFIWEQLDGDRPLGAICDALARQFDGAPADAARLHDEVRAFVDLLVRIGFAARVEAA